MDTPEHLTIESTLHKGLRAEVYLDGVIQSRVVEAHTGEGWLVRNVTDESGSLVLEGDANDPTIVQERLTGRVTAELTPFA